MNFQLFREIKTRYLFVQILAVLIFNIILIVAFSKVFKVHIAEDYYIISSFVTTLIWFFLTLSFIRRNNINIRNFIGKPFRKRYVFEIPVTLIISYIGSIGLILIMLFLVNCINPNIINGLQSNLVAKPPKLTTALITIISFAGTVIAAPIAEEFIFRGILISRLYNKYGVIKSIVFSSFIFFIAHLNPNPMRLCLGISCAILVYKYKSLIPSIMLHMCNNLLSFIRDLNAAGSQTASSDFTINSSFFIGGSILFIIYVIYSYACLRNAGVEDKLIFNIKR